MQFRHLILSSSCLCMLMSAAPVFAQDDPVGTVDGDAASDRSPVGEIIVTGSRVVANGNDAPTPLTVIDTDTILKATPTTVSDGLKQLPSFSLSTGTRSLGNSGANTSGSTLNLRGLGSARSLTLLDGRRVPGASASGGVDTNTLPQLLLKRVDIVTGGASAVYGTDAVAGVVNFVLDHNFNGVKAIAQNGISEYGDAAQYRLGFAAGTPLFGGSGHIEMAVDHYRSNGIDSLLDRPTGAASWDWLILPDGTRAIYRDVRAATAGVPAGGYGGLVLSGPFAGQQFAPNGTLVPFVHGEQPLPGFGVESGGDGSFDYQRSITADLDYDQIFVRYDQDLGAGISLFAQLSASETVNRNNFFPYTLQGVTLSSDNAFLLPEQRTALATAGVDTFVLSKTVDTAEPFGTSSRTRSISPTIGLNGALGDKFNWSAYYSYGQNKLRVQNIGNVNVAKQSAALDAVVDPSSGDIVCRVTLTSPGLYPGCVPLNPFGRGAEDPAAVEYARDTTYFTVTNQMHDFGASVAGTLFENWAGPVNVAVTGELRKMKAQNRSTAQPTDLADCTGLLYNCNAGAAFYSTDVTADFDAKQTIKEAAFEIGLPLLSDSPLARSLDLNAAVRYADYSVSGDAWTWKIGGDWQATDWLRFRATRSRDIRAPTLLDLFAPQSIRPVFFDDSLHTGTNGAINVRSSGNSSLTPEVANTLTFGTVIRPNAIPRLSFAVDYFQIEIANGIAGLGPNNQRCEDSNGTSPICDQIVRPLPFSDRTPANFPLYLVEGPVNIADQVYKGVDAELNYGFDVEKVGDFHLRVLGTYQIDAKNKTFPDDPFQELAGVASALALGGLGGIPRVKLSGLLTFNSGPLGVTWQTRWRSSMKRLPDVRPGFATNEGRLAAASFSNIGITYDMPVTTQKLQLFANVQNVFDKKPPVNPSFLVGLPGFFYPTYPEDDVMGRYYTMGLRLNF